MRSGCTRGDELNMMPLTMVREGERVRIAECRINCDAMRHLEELGILPGKEIQMLAVQGGDVIIKVNESRLAVNRGMANNVQVETADILAPRMAPLSGNHDELHGGTGVGLHSTRHSVAPKKRERRGFFSGS